MNIAKSVLFCNFYTAGYNMNLIGIMRNKVSGDGEYTPSPDTLFISSDDLTDLS